MIRVWKLGSLEHRILPTKEGVDKLAAILETKDLTDIIWGPDLEVEVIPSAEEDKIVDLDYCIKFVNLAGLKVIDRDGNEVKSGEESK